MNTMILTRRKPEEDSPWAFAKNIKNEWHAHGIRFICLSPQGSAAFDTGQAFLQLGLKKGRESLFFQVFSAYAG
jgi:hypothetical protein